MALNCNFMIWLIMLLFINAASKKISLSPYASWNKTGVTIAGWTNGTNGSSLSQLSRPLGISISRNDVLYISDTQNHRIIVVDLDSTTENFAISSGLGSDLCQFNLPYDLFVTDTSIYVNDLGNRRVQKLPLNGADPTIVLNYGGFYSPYYLYVDDNTNIYLSDTGKHRVLFFYSNSTNHTTVAGNGVNGSNDTQLNMPYGIFVNRIGTIYIADCYNHRIMKWFSGATSGICVAGDGSSGSSPAQLSYPTQIIVDDNEYMYISESGNSRITRWAPNSTFDVCIAACTGTPGTASTQLHGPHSLAFDSNGSLYVSEWLNHRVQKFQILDYHKNSTITAISPVKPTKGSISSSCQKQDEYQTTTIQQTTVTSTVEPYQTTTIQQTTVTSTVESSQPPSIFFVPTCPKTGGIGLNCTISSAPCDMLQPCKNNATCTNTDDNRGYNCSCPSGFNGSRCEFDHRPCKLNTCWNNGTCNVISNTTFNCICAPGWEGIHCERKTNYCYNITCQNKGVCRPLLLNYSCECLSGSYSGRHCEITATRIIIYKIVSKSFAYIAIIAMVSVVLFIIIMDILKYGFGIDPTREELERFRREKRARKRKPIIQRFVYVNAPSVPPTSEEPIATIAETAV